MLECLWFIQICLVVSETKQAKNAQNKVVLLKLINTILLLSERLPKKLSLKCK